MNVALLRTLRAAGGAFVPVAALGDPAQVGADLDQLIAFGFGIERHPLLGAAYRGPAERLCPDQIEDGLEGCRIGRRVAVWNRVGSTNDLAARAAASAANEGLVVLAEEQSAGRGRRGRIWTAPPRRSILMSVLLFPGEPLADVAWLTALGAVAVAELVEAWSGQPARIKWPNDVRVDGRKIAGILVERGAGAVVGIGLNANLDAGDFPPDLAGAATSLRRLTGAPVDRSELARDLILWLDRLYRQARADGPRPVADHWRDRSEHLGRDVVVAAADRSLAGRLVELDLLGQTVLEQPDGGRVALATRAVTSIGPAVA